MQIHLHHQDQNRSDESAVRELHLAFTESVAADLERVLFPADTPPESERGVIGVLCRSTGKHRMALLLRAVVEPRPGDVTWSKEEGLVFATGYKSRATDEAAATPDAGLIFIHTHPARPGSTRAPRPSPEDLVADRRDLYALGCALATGAPLAAAIVGENRAWSVREYRFRFPNTPAEAHQPEFGADAGIMTYATAVRVVGPRLRKLPTSHLAPGPAGAAGAISSAAQDSSIRLWGETGQRALATLRVGVVGTGGVGGILSEHVARLGAGETVHVDFDRIKFENLNRSQGATRDDAAARLRKVDVAKRNAEMGATAPGFRARAVEGSVVEAETVPELLDCDIVLNAADSPWARQVLDYLAWAHLIPVIHGGTTLRGDPERGALVAAKCEVSATAPGHPCSECAGVYSRADVTEAQEPPSVRGRRRYLELGEELPEPEEREPSVISFNAIVAGLMQLRLQAIALGTTPDAVVGTQRYYPLTGTLEWAATRNCRPNCDRAECTALGDGYALPLGRDLDFAAVRAETHAENGIDRSA